MTKENKCLVPKCDKTVNRRGVCTADYGYILGLIHQKKISEEKVVKVGLLLPRKRRRNNQEILKKLGLNENN